MKSIKDLILFHVESIDDTESPIEAMLYTAMMNSKKFILMKDNDTDPEGEGFFIFPQFETKGYRLDFLIRASGWGDEPRIYPPKRCISVCIECDGMEFHTDKDKDKQRDKDLLSIGIPTLRFTGSEIYRNSNYCVNQIIKYLENAVWRA